MKDSTAGSLPRILGHRDLVLVTIGNVIGSGIFIVPAGVLMAARGDVGLASLVWIAGGLLTLLGAFTYAELGAMKPEAGGLYAYLRDAFGGLLAFLYGWALFLVVAPATIAALAVAFTNYLGQFVELSPVAGKAVAIGLIAVIAVLNVRGTRQSADVLNWATGIKVGAILAMALFLFARGGELAHAPAFTTPVDGPLLAALGAGMIGVLWAYEGWHYVGFSAGEAQNPQRDFGRAIVGGTLILCALYLLASLAYVAALGPERGAASTRIAADAVSALYGSAAGKLIAAAILVSMFSAAHATALTSPRAFFAMARDRVFFQKLAEVHPRWGTPAFAVMVSCAWAAVMAASGTFEELLNFVVVTGWAFYALGAASLFWYRRHAPQAPRPYRTPFYPLTPALFVAGAGGLVLNQLVTDPKHALAGIGITLLGIPVYLFWHRRSR
ncbi:MAG TPA: amino acid permease [Candidatus Binatia bacterium]|nr:amino acid permease [Candidatus Binatia bacterium]